ncbi:immunity protein Imm33 domain-containing protein [Nitrincola sp. MINF-07-Sa-05]|uniref:immunity protein Imm33 domain-containing protein n=1 Tax=Nitrincola salilacus TaxID=3400273 RepID=UPI003917D652
MKTVIPDTTPDTRNETAQTKNGFLVLVSRLVFDEKLPVRFMYKTVPEHLNDTGWRLFTGYESEEFLADEALNLLPVPLEKIQQLDPSLTELLQYNAGTVWERTPDSPQWERVYDFKIPVPQSDVTITNDVDQFADIKKGE